MKQNNIILVGMMGAGKTTIGKELLNVLKNYTLIDMDSEIENREKMKISEIFKKYGEKHFRELETNLLKELSKNQNQIISTGGGVFEKEENRNILKETGTVFYLKASAEKLFDRIKSQTHRPLLQQGFGIEKVKSILDNREANYSKADIIIDTENMLPQNIVKRIVEEGNI